MGTRHGIINYVDTKAKKCRHLKKFTRKGRCLSGVTDWRNRQSCWYFRPSFVNCCPFNLSLIQLGMLSSVRDHILQEFNTTLYLTRFRTYKIARPTQTKPRRGGGLRQINTCRKVPLHVNFFRWRHFALVSIKLISPWYMAIKAVPNTCRDGMHTIHCSEESVFKIKLMSERTNDDLFW